MILIFLQFIQYYHSIILGQMNWAFVARAAPAYFKYEIKYYIKYVLYNAYSYVLNIKYESAAQMD